jgi:hypothetical protein
MTKLTKMKIVEQRGSYYFKRSLLQKKYYVWLEFIPQIIKRFQSIKDDKYEYIWTGVKQPKTFFGKFKWATVYAFIHCRWNMTYSIAPSPQDLDDIRWLRSLGNGN